MARYMERAENLARLLMANQTLALDSGSFDDDTFWEPILMTTGDEKAYHSLFSTMTGDQVREFLTAHPGNENSILSCIRSARENARMVRDQITDEMWRSVNDLYLFVTSDRARQMIQQSEVEFYEAVMQGSGLFQGVARATMMRDEGWQFFQIGTYLERADKTSRLIDACSTVALVMPPHPDARPLRWQALLRSCSAWHGYRESHGILRPQEVLEFLFLSPRFVRSVRFCVNEVRLALKELPTPPGTPPARMPLRLISQLFNDIDLAMVDEIIEEGLHHYIDQLQSRLNAIGDAIFQAHVLYADLTPLALPPHEALTHSSAGAWHHHLDMQIQQQQ
jgi:uncharacterized alpha-E superfamily protein